MPIEKSDVTRTDLYVVIKEGAFPAKKPSSLEVTMRIVSNDQSTPLSILRGTGISTEDQVACAVVPRQNVPRWEETFCIKLPADLKKITEKGGVQLVFSIFTISKSTNRLETWCLYVSTNAFLLH